MVASYLSRPGSAWANAAKVADPGTPGSPKHFGATVR